MTYAVDDKDNLGNVETNALHDSRVSEPSMNQSEEMWNNVHKPSDLSIVRPEHFRVYFLVGMVEQWLGITLTFV